MQFAILLIYGTFWIWGIFATTAPGMIFNKPSTYLWEKMPSWFCKPLFGCPPCMASVHGTAIWIYCDGNLIWLLPYVVCLAGINFIIKEHLYE